MADSELTARVAVLGGGITGLAAAHFLTRHIDRAAITIVEASERLGGVINSQTSEGLTLELGPDSLLTQKPWALKLIGELGLESEIIQTDSRFRRTFIAWDGKLHPLPEGFVMLAPTKLAPFLQSSLFTLAGKLRMCMEPFIPIRQEETDESLASFVRRRLGQEALDRVAQPMVAGIYTANAEDLSIQATMPRFVDLERKYGSIVCGLSQEQASGTVSGARYSLFVSLRGGLEQLILALQERLRGATIIFNAAAQEVTRDSAGRWHVKLSDGRTICCEAVVLATPAAIAGRLLTATAADLSGSLDRIPFASSCVINFVYERAHIRHHLDGFGFVVPAKEEAAIIACSFSSVKFPGRAPNHLVVMRAFAGGAMQPHVYALSDEEILQACRADLRRYLGITAPPSRQVLTRFPESMPQYRVGHMQLIQSIESWLDKLPGLSLAGNAYHGVGIPDCIHSAQLAVERVMRHLPA